MVPVTQPIAQLTPVVQVTWPIAQLTPTVSVTRPIAQPTPLVVPASPTGLPQPIPQLTPLVPASSTAIPQLIPQLIPRGLFTQSITQLTPWGSAFTPWTRITQPVPQHNLSNPWMPPIIYPRVPITDIRPRMSLAPVPPLSSSHPKQSLQKSIDGALRQDYQTSSSADVILQPLELINYNLKFCELLRLEEIAHKQLLKQRLVQ